LPQRKQVSGRNQPPHGVSPQGGLFAAPQGRCRGIQPLNPHTSAFRRFQRRYPRSRHGGQVAWKAVADPFRNIQGVRRLGNCADGGHEACSYLRSGFDRKGVPESENRLLALRHLAGVRAGWQVVEECIDSASAAQEGGENRPASLPTLEGRHAPPVRLVIADAPVSADEIFARPGPLATHGEAFAPLAVLSPGSFPRSRAPVRGAAFAITKS
jgi:hypothetical protein